jgi:hypothetical protein|nr:MAG TPA: tail tube protein [Caudoviricetes sp.]
MSMDAIRTMDAADVVSAKLASCYIIANGTRKLLFQAKDLKATVKKNKKQVAILGRMMKGNKSTSMEGSGKLTIYKNTSIFDEMIERMMKSGTDTYFDLQVTNEDPTSAAGVRTVILKGCNIDEGTVANFNADGEWLEDEINFTFEDVKFATKFNELDGMQA